MRAPCRRICEIVRGKSIIVPVIICAPYAERIFSARAEGGQAPPRGREERSRLRCPFIEPYRREFVSSSRASFVDLTLPHTAPLTNLLEPRLHDWRMDQRLRMSRKSSPRPSLRCSAGSYAAQRAYRTSS